MPSTSYHVPMKRQHIALAVMVAAIWGVNFSVIRIGLGSFPPIFLVAVRFMIVALPVLFLPRPQVPWPRMVAIATTLFIGQFTLLFLSMSHGMPAGLASVVLQAQAFLTMGFAALLFKERLRGQHVAGMLLACAGLALIASTAGGAQLSLLGFVLCVAAAACWAMGNVLLRGTGSADMMALMAWLSLVPPIPLFALSLVMEGPGRIAHAVTHIDGGGVFAVLYLSILSTTVGYGVWGKLIRQYPAAQVTPYALLVPVFGMLASGVLLGERFSAQQWGGVAMVLMALAVLLGSRAWLGRLIARLVQLVDRSTDSRPS